MLNKTFSNLIDKIRLLFRKDRESYLCFYRMLGFFPHDIRYYEQALLHKSFSGKMNNGRLFNNERLEFLGDAVLGAVVGDIVYQQFEGKREGFLTSTRSKIVSRESLNQVADQIGLSKMVKFTARHSTHNSNMGGNAFEALIGAIYLDRGYDYCMYFIQNRIIGQYIDLSQVSQKEVNFKSKMIEWSQKNKVVMVYQLTEQSLDESNSPVFETEVLLEGILAGKGRGYTKKESQQIAASEALDRIKKDSKFVDSVIAAKTLRLEAEEASEEAVSPDPEVQEEVPQVVGETLEQAVDTEKIISEAEEAAFNGEE